jgi:hypothetical protein
MAHKIKTDFGAINGQRVVTFERKRRRVLPAKFRRLIRADDDGSSLAAEFAGEFIEPAEAFRRWKIARKAWNSRRWRHQLPLPL